MLKVDEQTERAAGPVSYGIMEEFAFRPHPIRQAENSAVITGGTHGLGRALVNLLWGELNFAVGTCGRSEEGVQSLKHEHQGIYVSKLDLIKEQQNFSEKAFWRYPLVGYCNNKGYNFGRDAARALGHANLVILNAGISGLGEEKLTDICANGCTRSNAWLTSTVATYVALEKTIRETGGTAVFISTPLVHQRHSMKDGVSAAIEPYLNLKQATQEHLYRIFTRAGGPLCTAQGKARIGVPKPALLFIDPGSLDTLMHQQTLESGNALAERTMQLKKKGLLRDPAVVARIVARMAIKRCVFRRNEEDEKNPDYSGTIGSSNWVWDITDEAYSFEQANMHRAVMDPWWFDWRER